MLKMETGNLGRLIMKILSLYFVQAFSFILLPTHFLWIEFAEGQQMDIWSHAHSVMTCPILVSWADSTKHR